MLVIATALNTDPMPKTETGPRLNIEIPAATHRRLRLLSAVTGKSIKDHVNEWIDEKLPLAEAEAAKMQAGAE